MNRLQMRAPSKMRRRPVAARRAAAAHQEPIEYSAERATPGVLIILSGILGGLVVVECVVGFVVIA